MPSRKKAKGKARKAAKEEKSKTAAAVNQRQKQEDSLEAQIQRLRINAANSPEQCIHGRPPMSQDEEKIFQDFIDAFIAAYNSAADDMVKMFMAAQAATAEEFADVYSSKLEVVISALLAVGTQCILDGDNNQALPNAILACCFEEWTAVKMRKTKAVMNWAKIAELGCETDEHTFVQYYRKRIPCHCLDKKYEAVKSVKKMGKCCNLKCSLPGGKVERSRMLSCTRCGVANYCSRECQKADWKNHKEFCGNTAEEKAAFQAKQS